MGDLEPAAHRVTQQTFGQKVFTVLCQRVAYTSSLQAHEEALTRREQDPNYVLPPVDVSGDRYRQACRYGPHMAQLPADLQQRDPKVAALLENHVALVAALDAIFPAAELSELQDYLTRLLPLTDDGRFPDLIQTVARALGQLEQDEALLATLVRLSGRVGYRPLASTEGLVQELLTYPGLSALLGSLLTVVGEQGGGHQALLGLLEGLSFELQDAAASAEVSSPDEERSTLQLTLDHLLGQRTDLPAASSGAILLTQRDRRGVARPAGAGPLPAFFLDADADGLADIDDLGRLLTREGRPAPTPFALGLGALDSAPARDDQGRALDAEMRPLYAYLELDRSLLSALVRELPPLMEQGANALLELTAGLPSLLGAQQEVTGTNVAGQALRYQGYDVQSAPLLDLSYAALQLLRDPQLAQTFELFSRLLQEHEGSLARLAEAALTAWRVSERHPEAALQPRSNLLDDLLLLAREIAGQPGLIEDLLQALADPRTRNLGGIMANYLRYRDVHRLDQSSRALANPGFLEPVDRLQPDTGDNRSVHQRLLKIIYSTHGMKLCNKEGALLSLPSIGITFDGPFAACELFEIDDAAVFYTQSIARLRDAKGNLTATPKGHLRLKLENVTSGVATIIEKVGVDTVLGLLGGIDGLSSHPAPIPINRLMFLRSYPEVLAEVMDPPRDIFGRLIWEEHQGTMMSWEVRHPQYSCSDGDPCTFYDAIQPVIQAFADHDAEPLFVRTMATLYLYWASGQSGSYQFSDPLAADYNVGAGLVSYEPLLAELIETGSLLGAVGELARVLEGLRLSDGSRGSQVFARFLTFLVDPERTAGLSYRDGRTVNVAADGSAVAGGVSPIYLLLDAWRRCAAALEQPAQQTLAGHWRAGLAALGETLLAVERQGDQVVFRSRRLVPLVLSLLELVQQRVLFHSSKGDLQQWLSADLPGSVAQALAGPVPPRLLELARALAKDPAASAQLYALARHLFGEDAAATTFQSTLTGLADLLQLLPNEENLIPVLRTLGRLLDPRLGLGRAAVRFLQPAVNSDSAQALPRTLQRAYQPLADGRIPLQVLLDVASSVHRQQPGDSAPLTGEDLAEILRQAREFFGDSESGLIRFLKIVEERCGGPC